MNNLNINGPIRTASDHGTTLATRFSIYLGSMLNCSRMWSKVLLVTLFLVCSGTAQVKFTSASDIAAAATSSAATVSWTAMGDWTAKIDVDWLTFPISSGSAGSWGRTLNWGSNPTKQSRVGHLTIGTAVVTVTQAGGDTDWIQAKFPQYTVFYTDQYSGDLSKAQGWLDLGIAMMQSRYQLTALPRGVSLYLHPNPTSGADTSTAHTDHPWGLPPEIHYLTPSSPPWISAGVGTLGNAKNSDDYHAYIVVHEFTHVVQDALRTTWDFPAWVYEGMATYEGLFNSTPFNRDNAPTWLGRWIKGHSDAILCCQTLAGEGFNVNDQYNSAGFFWHFVTSTFSSDVNRQVYTSPTSDPLQAVEAATSITSASDLFSQLLTFFKDSTSAVRFVEISGVTALNVTASSGSVGLNWYAWANWTATVQVDWLAFGKTSGTPGSYGTYPLSWASNPYCSSRVGVLTIGDATVTVNQAAATTGCLPKP
jgi:hypothetical protein